MRKGAGSFSTLQEQWYVCHMRCVCPIYHTACRPSRRVEQRSLSTASSYATQIWLCSHSRRNAVITAIRCIFMLERALRNWHVRKQRSSVSLSLIRAPRTECELCAHRPRRTRRIRAIRQILQPRKSAATHHQNLSILAIRLRRRSFGRGSSSMRMSGLTTRASCTSYAFFDVAAPSVCAHEIARSRFQN